MFDLFALLMTHTSTDYSLATRLLVDVAFMAAFVGGIYARIYRHHEYVFTYVLLNLLTFCLTFVLSHSSMELGFALGLFAVFGILRYRTEPIRTRDLTYLFVVIGMGLLNALCDASLGLSTLVTANAVVFIATVALESNPWRRHRTKKLVRYDQIGLLDPARAEELKRDIRERTGLPVEKIVIEEIDLLRDTATLSIYYPPTSERP